MSEENLSGAEIQNEAQNEAHDNEPHWYVVHTYSGYENKVMTDIKKTISNRHLEERILDVIVPLEDVQETKNGVTKIVQRKLFPGYVLVNMYMDDDTWYVVRNTRGVTGFVGPESKPVPLTEREMKALGFGAEEAPAPKVIVEYEADDPVTVVAGAWKGTKGKIASVNSQKQTVTINIDLFGRETPVEIGFAEIKKD